MYLLLKKVFRVIPGTVLLPVHTYFFAGIQSPAKKLLSYQRSLRSFL